MEHMFQAGFLGTRAPLFMDIVTLIVALLPFLVFGAIALAKGKRYQTHATVQQVLFVVSLIVVGYFEYGVRNFGGFEAFMQTSHTSRTYALWVLIIHIVISVISLGIWSATLLNAHKARKNKTLQGSASFSHKRAGVRTFIGIVLTSVTGLWVYVLLFIY